MEEEKYLPELMAERDSLDPSFVHASRLLAEGRTCPRVGADRWPPSPRRGSESGVREDACVLRGNCPGRCSPRAAAELVLGRRVLLPHSIGG